MEGALYRSNRILPHSYINLLDPYEKEYETFSVMASECKEGCDTNATCGCNLRSGNFKCACRKGYYGTGERRASEPSCYRKL